jgi:hypothetical protein
LRALNSYHEKLFKVQADLKISGEKCFSAIRSMKGGDETQYEEVVKKALAYSFLIEDEYPRAIAAGRIRQIEKKNPMTS